MTLLLSVLVAQAPAFEGERPVVDRVELRLPAGVDEKLLDRITELVTVRRGQRLSRRAVRRSIEGLFESRRFADVVARVEPSDEGVAVVFELVPRQSVADVFFESPGGRLPLALRNDLLAAGRLTEGAEYWPERGEQAAEAMGELLRRRGFRDASVTHTTLDGELGLAVGFTVSQGAPTLVRSVTVAGDPGLEVTRLLGAMGVTTGQVLDLDVAQRGVESLRALLRSQGYFRARVDPPVVFEGGQLVVPVRAGPRYDLVFTGNRRLTDAALLAVLGYDGEETLDGLLASRLARRLERFYRFRGFHDARVTASETRSLDGARAALGFVIVEGDPLRVSRVEFSGNQAIGAPELRDILSRVIEGATPTGVIEAHGTSDPLSLEGRARPPFAADFPAPPPLSVLDEDAYVEALKAMTAQYRERGYLKAVVKLDAVDRDGAGQAVARFSVTEGAQARFRLVQLQGVPRGFRSETVELVKTNSPFSVAALEQIRQGVIRELSRRGYLYADVEASYALELTGKFADCVLQVKAGPQVRVRTVLPVGAVRTDEEVLLRQATMVEGQPLDAESLFTTQSNLLGTGIFRTVEVETLAPERAEPLKTVLLKVKERPRISGEVGLGYFLAEGPRVVLDAAAPNLGGKAVNLALRAQINWFALSFPALNKNVDVSDLDAVTQLGGRGNLSIQNRGLLPFDIGWRVDVVGERVFRPQFRFTRWAGIPSLDWTRSFEIPRIETRLKVSLALQYEVEWARVQETSARSTSVPLTFIDQERLRFLFGTFALQTVRFQPTFDLRDNALSPHKGVLLQGSAEVTGALYAGTPIAPGSSEERAVPVSFFKTSVLATGYIPLSQRVVLALSLRGGRIVPLVSDAVTPPVKRFFLGGATSMRGFNEDQLIAQDRRAQYQEQIAACQVLASKSGCTAAASTVAAGRQIPSEGGEFFGLAKAEVRFPGFSVFDVGLFFETGNLWLGMPAELNDFTRLRYVLGTGVRYVTPIGPLALDVGVNLAPDLIINEPRVVAHFNIGVF
ncbi:MAG: BamA/TamA family outer membrane protein [Myxococcus sp.]|nr:BamA/TamA family outer membrane protein [Myxococcus sp.]